MTSSTQTYHRTMLTEPKISTIEYVYGFEMVEACLKYLIGA